MVESRLYLNIDRNCYIGFRGIAEQKVKNVLIKQLGFQSLVNLDLFFSRLVTRMISHAV